MPNHSTKTSEVWATISTLGRLNSTNPVAFPSCKPPALLVFVQSGIPRTSQLCMERFIMPNHSTVTLTVCAAPFNAKLPATLPPFLSHAPPLALLVLLGAEWDTSKVTNLQKGLKKTFHFAEAFNRNIGFVFHAPLSPTTCLSCVQLSMPFFFMW